MESLDQKVEMVLQAFLVYVELLVRWEKRVGNVHISHLDRKVIRVCLVIMDVMDSLVPEDHQEAVACRENLVKMDLQECRDLWARWGSLAVRA